MSVVRLIVATRSSGKRNAGFGSEWDTLYYALPTCTDLPMCRSILVPSSSGTKSPKRIFFTLNLRY